MDRSSLAMVPILFLTLSLAIQSSAIPVPVRTPVPVRDPVPVKVPVPVGAPLPAKPLPPFYCRLNEVKCPSGIQSCVHVLGICNGIRDCPDGSDENVTMCKSYDCSNHDLKIVGMSEEEETGVPYFRSSKCPSGNICTKKYTFEYLGEILGPDEEHPQVFFKCTGGPNECADGSDENRWFCRNLDCSKGEDNRRVATCPSKKYCLYPKYNGGSHYGVNRLCDGTKDCPDGSDEWPSFCKTNNCSTYADTTFRCKDFGCVKTEQICNGVRDCGDGSDEDPAFCASYKCDWSGGKKCPDRRTCLKNSTICDGKRNCPDGNDEAVARCRAFKCEGGKWKCNDGLQCAGEPSAKYVGIIDDPRCDNKVDCNDKSDETRTLCKAFDCGEGRMKCPGTGTCIGPGKLCDGKRDCLDGSDEWRIFCANYQCDTGYQVKCKTNNLCVRGRYCDGRVDCDDKSDEDHAFCQMYKCPQGYSKCPNLPYQCVPNEFLCDGKKKQCINGGDEDPTFCKSYTCPGVKCNLTCQDGRFCDGYNDCPDGSDERPGFCRYYRCPKDYAKCKDGKQCVNHFHLCAFDGRDPGSCLDKSEADLAFCRTYDCGASRGTGYFKCSSNSTKCFRGNQWCDGKVDCPGNNIDENPATCEKFTCPDDWVKCPDKRQCIFPGRICDGTPDCKGGAEENRAFCSAYKCPIIAGVQYVKCKDNLRCTDPAIPC